MSGETALGEAEWDVLLERCRLRVEGHTMWLEAESIRAALAPTVPGLVAAVEAERERIAAAIEAERDARKRQPEPDPVEVFMAFDLAARIARGATP